MASAEVLSKLYHIPLKHEYIKDHFMPLFSEHQYGLNILNVKMTNPEDDNYSDDEQAFQTFHLFYWTVLRNTKCKFFDVGENIIAVIG